MSSHSPESASSAATVSILSQEGTSVWLDDLSRTRLDSGNLADIIQSKGIRGVTTNPAIFAAAMSSSDAYKEQLAELSAQGIPADTAVFTMAIADVQRACDLFLPLYESSDGVDGRVSLEVDPRLAHDADATIIQAKTLAESVNRPNLMIKIPATEECLPAISAVLAEGISVNVTLIFSVARYRQVIQTFIDGLARAQKNNKDISSIHSVASFFVSRVDTEIDKRLEAIAAQSSDSESVLSLKGKAALANARLAYEAFEKDFADSEIWAELKSAGAHIQRPLWASTSVKDPSYPDTLYVTELVGPHTVNTMPEATLDALIDHGHIQGNTLSHTAEESHALFTALGEHGIDLLDVYHLLESEGVEKFVQSWEQLLEALQTQLESLS